MSKERGGAVGASMSSSIGASRGGVGLAERSASTGFSSRGLSAFNTSSERSAMSSIKTAGPSLNLGRSERPSLSLGKSAKPSLSLRGSTFESTKNTIGKTRGSAFATASENFSPHVSASPAKVESNKRSNGIEVTSVMPQTKAVNTKESERPRESINRLPVFEPMLKAEPKGPVTPKNLDASVPVSVAKPAERAKPVIEKLAVIPQSKKETPAPQMSSPVLVTQKNLDRAVPFAIPKLRESAAKTVSPGQVDMPRIVVRDALSQPKQEEEAPKISIAPRIGEVTVTSKAAPSKFELEKQQKTEKPEVTVTVKTDDLARLALWARKKEKDDKKRKEKQQFEQAQVERVAHAYVRAGLAMDFGDGMRKVQRFLTMEPAVLAKNQLKIETLPGIATPAQPLQAVESTTLLEQVKSIKAAEAVVVYDRSEAAPDHQLQYAGPTTPPNNNETPNQARVTYDEVEEEIQEEPETPVSFKVDEQAQRNREIEWEDAVRQMFPAFDYTAETPLRAVASVLQPPSKETNSGLIYQVGKNVDGSNDSDRDWRTPLLTSTALVTAAQARITGLHEIYDKPPVVMKSWGRNVRKNDVDLVLSGDATKDRNGMAA